MSNRGYRFWHENAGNNTGMLSVPNDTIVSDDLAKLRALMYARKLLSNGLATGSVKVGGYWEARGFEYSVLVVESDKLHHPYEDLPSEPLPGYEQVADIIAKLWPWEGPQPVKEQSFGFSVWGDKVAVTISRPRGNLVAMFYNGQEVQGYHAGPSIFVFVTTWGVTQEEAVTIWSEVCEKVRAFEVVYLK